MKFDPSESMPAEWLKPSKISMIRIPAAYLNDLPDQIGTALEQLCSTGTRAAWDLMIPSRDLKIHFDPADTDDRTLLAWNIVKEWHSKRISSGGLPTPATSNKFGPQVVPPTPLKLPTIPTVPTVVASPDIGDIDIEIA